MASFIFAWLCAWFVMNFIIQVSIRADLPFEKRSLGYLITWPIYVVFAIIIGSKWVVLNFGGAIRESLDPMIKR